MNPRVALGLPVYNGANFLRQSLEAIRAQTFTDFELVISDNASTDTTERICKELADVDPRVTYIRQPVNLGAAPNYNAVFHAAPRSEYFAWVAHDDVPAPEFLGACVAALDEQPDAVLAFPLMTDIDGDGAEIGIAPSRPGLMSPDPAVRLADVINQRNRNDPVFGLMRTEVVQDTSLHGSFTGSDRTLMAEMALRGPFVEIDRPLFSIRQHDGRSVRIGTNRWAAHVREAWFDTSRAGKVVFPKWRRAKSYVDAVNDAPLTGAQRRAARRELITWLGDKNWKALAFDVVLAATDVAKRVPVLSRR